MGYIDGLMREWRWILSLQLFGYEGVRSHCSGGYLCPGMSTYERGVDVWDFSVAEEDEAYEDHEDVV